MRVARALYRGEGGGMHVQFGIFVQSDLLQLLLGEDFFVHGAEAHEDGLHVTDDVIRGVPVRSHTAFAPRDVSDCARMQACSKQSKGDARGEREHEEAIIVSVAQNELLVVRTERRPTQHDDSEEE